MVAAQAAWVSAGGCNSSPVFNASPNPCRCLSGGLPQANESAPTAGSSIDMHATPLILKISAISRLAGQFAALLCAMPFVVSCEKQDVTTPRKKSDDLPKSNAKIVPAENSGGTQKLPPLLREAIIVLEKKPTTPEVLQAQLAIVHRLGREKCVEAIPTLLDHMLEIRPVSLPEPGFVFGAYPCSEALAQIGEPAIKPVRSQLLVTSPTAEFYGQQRILITILLEIKGEKYVIDWLKEGEGQALPKATARSNGRVYLTQVTNLCRHRATSPASRDRLRRWLALLSGFANSKHRPIRACSLPLRTRQLRSLRFSHEKTLCLSPNRCSCRSVFVPLVWL